MVSWQSRAAVAAFRMVPRAALGHVFTHPPRRSGAVPRWVCRDLTVDRRQVAGGSVITLAPRWPAPGRHVVYLHGGAYTLQGSHWSLVSQVIRRSGCTVSYLDYPLAPEHSWEQTVAMVVAAWSELGRRAPEVPLTVMGDSAGGGLALVLMQTLRDAGLPGPRRSVLFSPWVDLVMDDAETTALARTEPLLPPDGLRGAARLYARGADLHRPELSPARGDLHDLGAVLALVGTREMFLPQVRRLAERAAHAPGTTLTLREYPDMPHAWPLFGLPESRAALDEASDFLWGGAVGSGTTPGGDGRPGTPAGP